MQYLRKLAIGILPVFAGANAVSATMCADLGRLSIPAVTLRAEDVTAGPFSPVGGSNAIQLPAFSGERAAGS